MNINKTIWKNLLTLSVLVFSANKMVLANDGVSVGAYYSSQEVFEQSFSVAGVSVEYQFNRYFGIESRLGTGITKEGYHRTGFHYRDGERFDYEAVTTRQIDYQFSVDLQGRYPIFKTLDVYAGLGYSNTDFNNSHHFESYEEIGGDLKENSTYERNYVINGLSYTAGLSYRLNEHFNLFFDYKVLPDYDKQIYEDETWTSATLGLRYRL